MNIAVPPRPLAATAPLDPARFAMLRAIERKLLWLSAWTIHNANHVRPNRDGLKVGGHQASCASIISVMTALYFEVLRPQDRVAVKPHAGPVFHAINHLLGRQTREQMEGLRQFGGAQSYPSRVKDGGEVDFSTGSVGLGVAITSFAALMADYIRLHGFARADIPPGRHIAIAGDAELDEGNIYEALLEGWKHDVRNVWWIDDCPNSLYSALTFQGGAAWRQALLTDLGRARGVRAIIDPLDDEELATLMTNLGGHDIEAIIEHLRAADAAGDQPTCFIAYTIKGMGLPFAGHKDNHAGLMSKEQMELFRHAMGIRPGHEWDRLEGLGIPAEALNGFIASVPFATPLTPEGRALAAPLIPIPDTLPLPKLAGRKMSTQAGFGDILADIGRGHGALKPLAERIMTTSPDVTVSTNLGPWVNRRGVFDRHTRNDVFRDSKLASAQRWGMSPEGQHIELGIAEQNLFLLLGAAGLSHSLTGARILPIGTVYDPFVNRGLDSLIYACYQDARFLLVSTPSGLTLAPEGGQHQSVNTPLIGMAADRLASFEPSHVDELAILLRHAFDHMQRPDGSAVWLRLSTRQLAQPDRKIDPAHVIAGAHWVVPPGEGAPIALAYQGPVAPEAEAAFAELREEEPRTGLLAITSPDRLHAVWLAAARARRTGDRAAISHIERSIGNDPRRPSRRPCLARRGPRPARGPARPRPFRPER
jgi:pyruvate dehydrogenase E1 component